MSAIDAAALQQHLLLSSPPGQFQEVAADVARLGPALPGDLLDTTYLAYLRANAGLVPLPGEPARCLLVTDDTMLTPPHVFVDTVTRKAYTVSPRGGAGVATPTTGEPLPAGGAGMFAPALESYRAALASGLAAYIATSYGVPTGPSPPPALRGGAVVSLAGSLVLSTSVVVTNLPNFWAGAWRGRWIVGFPAGPGAGKAVLTGGLSLRTHFFEAGNVQTGAHKPTSPVSVEFHDGASLAKAVLAVVAAVEADLVSALEEAVENLGVTLKELRRGLPLTGNKFDWGSLQAIRQRRLMNANAAGRG